MSAYTESKERLRIPGHKNTNYEKSGPKAYAKVLHKYGITPTKEGSLFKGSKVEHRGKFTTDGAIVGGRTFVRENVLLKRNVSGSGEHVPATDIQHDAEYLCPVSIGSPAQKLMLDFDTGSSDLWVWSDKLPSDVKSQYGSQHTVYDSTKSTSFQASEGSTWKIQYGDSSTASGTVGTDTVAIGDVTVKNQGIELADNLSEQFQQGAGDGLLGLAWPNINTVQPKPVATPVQNMIDQGDIPASQQLFTAWLSSDKDAGKGTSWYTFGWIDADALKTCNATANDIAYTPIDNTNGFWQFPSTSAKINGQTVQVANNTAIADTGTTLALVSDEVCDAVYKAIPGSKYDQTQQGYVFPSNTPVAKLPTVEVAVGNATFTIHKADLSFADAGNGMTYGGIQSRGTMPLDILGDVFLKGVYAVFDQGGKRFGAVQRPEQQTAPTEVDAPTRQATTSWTGHLAGGSLVVMVLCYGVGMLWNRVL